VAAFYEQFFGMRRLLGSTDGWLELASPSGGCNIALHRAARSQKSGAAAKIVFAAKDVEAFVQECAKQGLHFGKLHLADGFEYANAKDPAGNSISVSSRGL
jgi:predicted enzyme related to lactoylglutathione lyase